MITSDPSRRRFLAGTGALGAAALASGCVTSASSGRSAKSGGAVTIQSNYSAPQAKAAMQDLVSSFNERGDAKATLNTVASETYRTQLPTYLTSASPPDVYTWYSGSVANSYAKKGLLLDLSDVWQSPELRDYPAAMKKLSTDDKGKQIIVPSTYYWWGMFYRKSKFAEWGVKEPATWDAFLDLCDKLKSKGIAPIGLGAGGNTPWVASAWFDYLNIRINGAQYHRDLLVGKHRFDDPEVRRVFERWRTVLPYFDDDGTAIPFEQATTKLLQGQTGMMLIGTFFADSTPKDALDDIDFFRFPVIDPKVPLAEEAPTDGYFVSARTGRDAKVGELLRFLATPEAQETYIKGSSGTVLPTNPKAKDAGTPLVAKGKKMVAEAEELTQFFNRDSSDALQPSADTALTKFIAKPDQLGSILGDWQQSARKIWTA